MMQAEREDWGVAELYASALVERQTSTMKESKSYRVSPSFMPRP